MLRKVCCNDITKHKSQIVHVWLFHRCQAATDFILHSSKKPILTDGLFHKINLYNNTPTVCTKQDCVPVQPKAQTDNRQCSQAWLWHIVTESSWMLQASLLRGISACLAFMPVEAGLLTSFQLPTPSHFRFFAEAVDCLSDAFKGTHSCGTVEDFHPIPF